MDASSQTTLWQSFGLTSQPVEPSSPPLSEPSRSSSKATRSRRAAAIATVQTTLAMAPGAHAGAISVDGASLFAPSTAGFVARPTSSTYTGTPITEYPRPATRADCEAGPRPCPWASCRHHLLVHLRRKGTPVLNGTHRALRSSDAAVLVRTWIDEAIELMFSMADTCALDVADRGKLGPKAIGRKLGITKVRVDQVNAVAEPELRQRLVEAGISEEDLW